MNGTIDLDTDTIKVALVLSTYTPDQDNHEFFDDVTNEHAATGNYTAGGNEINNKAVTQDNTNNWGKFDGDNVEWANSTITNARAGVIYKDTGTAATSPLIRYHDFGANKSTVGTTFKITWDATNGILNSKNP
jgi:hypothetical protein